MHGILVRLFLLLLLAGDWAWDPFHGNCPFTHAFASTDAVLNTAPDHLAAHCRLCRPHTPRLMTETVAPALLLSPVYPPLRSSRPRPGGPASDRIYALMCILR